MFVFCRSWPQIGDGWQPVVSQPNSTNSKSPQLAAYTVSDQRHKVGINSRPQTHDIASLPSFKTIQRTYQSDGEQSSRPHSEATMCKLPAMTKIKSPATFRRQNELRFASDGLSVRHSSYRSLASNPNLKVETVNGRVTVSRRRRAKSLPPKLQEKQLTESPTREDTVNLAGWHRRSRSPTFTTLAQAKDHLDAALSRKLWEIRRHIDGQRARENSAVFSEYSTASAAPNPDTNPGEWYERMLREHSDEDLAAIETLCIANYDDQLLSTDSITLDNPKPKVDFCFDKHYLKAHINDWNVLALMQEEERKRAEKEMRKAKQQAGRPPAADQIGTKTKSYIKQIVAPKAPRKQQNSVPLLPKPEPVIEESISERLASPSLVTIGEPVTEVVKSPEPLVIKSNEDSIVETKTTENLVAKYLGNREPIMAEPVVEKQTHDVVESDNGDSGPNEQPEVEKKLTEKEKFLLMRKRMEDIKAEKAKKRDAADYVRLGMNVRKGANNFLGTLMSSRLEKITTFKSKSGDDDDDDDYDTDDDDDDNDTDDD